MRWLNMLSHLTFDSNKKLQKIVQSRFDAIFHMIHKFQVCFGNIDKNIIEIKELIWREAILFNVSLHGRKLVGNNTVGGRVKIDLGFREGAWILTSPRSSPLADLGFS